MPAADFHTVPLSSITIDRQSRQRRELDPREIEVLADSIKRLGLIHPPVLTRDRVLVSGERRIEAVRSLGWSDIPIQYTDEVAPSTLRAIELEENVKRLDLPWQNHCCAVAEYHELRRAEDPSWTQAATATALGFKPETVASKLKVAEELQKGNERVVNAPKYSTARGIIERSEQRKAANELEKFEKVGAPVPAAPSVESVLNVDFLKWAPAYDGPRFNLIHCDFPYGIGANKFHQGSAPLHGGYDDSPDVYRSLMACLFSNLDRLALESCHLVFWFSMSYYEETLNAIRKGGFVCDGFPLIWLKSDNVGTLPDPERGPRRVYETALFGVRGDRKVVNAVANGYAAPTDRADREHMSVKPEPVLRHFFRMLCDEHTRLLDPTCGSGSALRAAESLGAKHVLGLERDKEFAEGARLALAKARKLKAS